MPLGGDTLTPLSFLSLLSTPLSLSLLSPQSPTPAPGYKPALFCPVPHSILLSSLPPTAGLWAPAEPQATVAPGWGWGSGRPSGPISFLITALPVPTDGLHPDREGWGAWVSQGPRLFLMQPAQKINIPPLPPSCPAQTIPPPDSLLLPFIHSPQT